MSLMEEQGEDQIEDEDEDDNYAPKYYNFDKTVMSSNNVLGKDYRVHNSNKEEFRQE